MFIQIQSSKLVVGHLFKVQTNGNISHAKEMTCNRPFCDIHTYVCSAMYVCTYNVHISARTIKFFKPVHKYVILAHTYIGSIAR